MNLTALSRAVRPRTSAVVFDAGQGGVRAAQARGRGAQRALTDLLAVEFVAGEPPTGGAPSLTDPARLGRLARLIGQGRFRGRDAAVVLAPPDVYYHAMRFPESALKQSPQRVIEALAWELARETRADAAELEVRYWELPHGHREGFNVMAVAMPARNAELLADALGAHELRLTRIESSASALARAARLSVDPGSRDLWGILDVGRTRSQLIAVVGETPVYVRSLPISSDEWTRLLAEGFEVSPAVAETLKRAHGLLGSDRAECEASPLEDVSGVSMRLLRASLERLVREINVCLSYALQYYADTNVTRIELAGGGARMRGLREYLESIIGVPVGIALGGAAGARLRADAGPEAAAAIGAALLELEA